MNKGKQPGYEVQGQPDDSEPSPERQAELEKAYDNNSIATAVRWGMRRIQLVSHLTADELETRYRRAHESTERGWWQILWLLSRGQTAKLVAENTGYSRYWIGQIAKRYNAEGPAGMVNRHTPGCGEHPSYSLARSWTSCARRSAAPRPRASAGQAER